MKNKKGFTLVEILVSIGLLALLGSVIAISLNRVFKDNNKKHYNEYVEKIKSSAMLFVNNTVDIINDLNDNSFKIITIGDLIDNGYVNDSLVNPSTDEKVGKEEKIQVSYDSDHELIVTYPYTNDNKESYLYTLNYSVMYGDTTEDLCYVGLNTRSLQLINPDGTPVKDNNSNKILVPEQNIKAYMENGEECTNLNLSSDKIEPQNQRNSAPSASYWNNVINKVKQSGKMAIYVNLIGSKASQLNDMTVEVELANRNDFGREMLEKYENKALVEKFVSEEMRKSYAFKIYY